MNAAYSFRSKGELKQAFPTASSHFLWQRARGKVFDGQ